MALKHTIKHSRLEKDKNVRAHSKPGSIQNVPAKKKAVLKEFA